MLLHQDITETIIKSFYKVYNSLGYGFLERVYENALCIVLRKSGLKCSTQQKIEVFYKRNKVGLYFADIVVEDKVIIELKASLLIDEHEYQLLNYLKATKIEIGLLLGFGKEASIKRKIFTNDRKSEHLKKID